MRIEKPGNITFGYKNVLKTKYKKGKLPTVIVDPYGVKLTKDTATLDHIIPYSVSKRTKTDNLLLADYWENNQRSNKPLSECTTKEKLIAYFQQFIGVKIKGLNGNEYIKSALPNVRRQGIDINEYDVFIKGGGK